MQAKQRNGYANRKFVAHLIPVICLCLTGWAARAAEPVLEFDGGSAEEAVELDATLILADDFTIEYWFNTQRASDWRLINNDADLDYTFGPRAANEIAFWDPGVDIELTESFAVNAWEHFAVSRSNNTLRIYRNGNEVGSDTWSGQIRLNRIGGTPGNSGWDAYAGQATEVRAWDHVRSEAQIETLMNYRLAGGESGLVGYWPMNEGTGDKVYDGSTNAKTGTVSNAEWVVAADLELPSSADADFLEAQPFTLADIETGSTEFTNSNEVDIVDFPVPDGYDQFQLTESGEIGAVDPNEWESTNAVPGRIDFPQPGADTNLIQYAWFTNETDAVTLRRAEGGIYYTGVPPEPSLRATHSRQQLPGEPVVIMPDEIDDGSTGGEADGQTMTIHTMWLNVESGPDTDATPDDPWVTVSELGEYTLSLSVMNEAGNVATSTVTCTLTVEEYAGQFTWIGDGDGIDWHDGFNWNVGAVPVAGEPVVISNSASVFLSESTAALSSLWLTNATLTMATWETVLTADTVTVEDGGVIRHDGPHNSFINAQWPDWVPSNRIHIVCVDLTVASGGELVADFKGYSGGRREGTGTGTEWGHGPGASRGVCSNDEPKAGGAGHGGRGGNGRPTPGGPVYGCAIHPETPGSGAGGGHSAAGAHGGGVIRVNATGRITVDGLLSANGANASTSGPRHTAGGAGGSIYLICETFAGQGGIVRATGGDKATNHSGGGGGGRIALHYDAAAQALEPLPSVTFTAAPGDNYRYRHMVWYWNWCRRGTGTGFSEEAQWGSLYFTDPTGVIGLGTGDTVEKISGFLRFGEGVAFEDGTLEFAVDNLTVANGATLGFDTNSAITITGDLEIAPGSGLIARHPLSVAAGGELRLKGKLRADRETALDIGGDLTIDGGRLRVRKPDVAVGGVLALLNDGWLVTQTLEDGAGGQVVVAGDISLATNCWIYPVSHQTAGGATRFVCREMYVAEDAGFDAGGAGYSADEAGPGGGTHYHSTTTSQGAGGGGYGGRGGDGLMRDGGDAYPADYNARYILQAHPGSAGGRSFQVEQAGGGGAIWIETDGSFHLDGSLRANGHAGRAAHGRRPGSGSGGGILVMTERLYGGPQSMIEALGGNQSYSSATAYGGAGGGGRIAIWYGLKAAERQPVFDRISEDAMQYRIHAMESLPLYAGAPITALAGEETRPPSEDDRVDAQDGTVAFLRILSPPGSLIQIR